MNDVIEIFADLTEAVNADLMPTFAGLTLSVDGGSPVNRGIENVNYFYGPVREIIRKLQQWNASDTYEPKRYPLIALIQPFNQVQGDSVGIQEVNNLDIAICMLSVKEWDTPTRYANNFNPILRPIVDSLLDAIDDDGRVLSVVEQLQFTKIEWPFWDAGQEKNPFNDVLDVIELKNLKLKVLTPNCQ